MQVSDIGMSPRIIKVSPRVHKLTLESLIHHLDTQILNLITEVCRKHI